MLSGVSYMVSLLVVWGYRARACLAGLPGDASPRGGRARHDCVEPAEAEAAEVSSGLLSFSLINLLITRMAGNFSHLGLAEQFFGANLEIFILEGPLHDRYIRPLHRRGTVTHRLFWDAAR